MLKSLRFITISAVAVTIALTAACSKRLDTPDLATPLSVSASRTEFASADTSGGATKATEVKFQSGDAIGLYIHSTAEVGASANHSSNLKYITQDGGGTWQTSSAMTAGFTVGTTYYTSAYYPYKSSANNPTAIEHTVAVDQNSAGQLEASDFMVAPANGVSVNDANTAKASLDFKHVLTKFVISIDIPEVIDGTKVLGVASSTVIGVKNNCTVNLATSAVSATGSAANIATKAMGSVGGVATFEAIVVPQTVAANTKLVEFVFNMAGGTTAKMYYYTGKNSELTFTSGEKRTLIAVANSDLSFVSTPTFSTGDAALGVSFAIKAGDGRDFALTTNVDWLTFATTAGGPYAKSITGTGVAGNITIYASVAANSVAPYNPREAMLLLTDGKDASNNVKVSQNYSKFEPITTAWNVAAGRGQVNVIGAFSANRVWSAYFGNNSNGWVTLNSSATVGAGVLPLPHQVTGNLAANTLWLQTSAANNTAAAKTEKLLYKIDGQSAVKELIITQAAPVLGVSANQNVAPHITSAAFNVTAAVNHWGVNYTPTVGVNATSVAPNTAQEVNTASAYVSPAITVGFTPNTTNAARNITSIVSYGAGKTATFTATQAVASLTISPASASVGADVASSAFTLTSNVPYSSTYSAGGSSPQGVGNTPPYTNAAIAFNYPAQPATPSAARNHTMTLTPNPANSSSAVARTFIVTQAARPVSFTISSSAPGEAVPQAGKAYVITVNSNTTWGIANAANVSVSPSSGTGTANVTITVAPSAAGATREVKVDFVSSNNAGQSNVTRTWVGSQAVASFVLNSYAANVGADVASSAFTLTSNVPYSSTYSAGGSSPQGVGGTPPYTNAAIAFNYPAQPAAPSAARNHTMTITPGTVNGSTSVARTFTVTQAARPVSFTISSSAPGVTIPKGGGSYTTVVSSNTAWTASGSNASVSPSSGSGNATVTITVGANTASATRAISATFTSSNTAGQTDYTRTWSGTQEQAGPPVVNVGGAKWTASNLTGTAGQSTSVAVAANPQDYGMFYKWGDTWTYQRPSSSSDGTWTSQTSGASTNPSSSGTGDTGYDYGSLSGGRASGDPCKLLGAYRTPTRAQWQALVASGKSAWTTYNGIAGYFFGPKAASCNSTTIQDDCIFLPAAGSRGYSGGALFNEGSHGYYRSSSVYDSTNGYYCYFYSSRVNPGNYDGRGNGFSVRCVQE